MAHNFIQRWNHHKAVNGEKSYPALVPKTTEYGRLRCDRCDSKLTFSASRRLPTKSGTCQVQVVRSLCEWSGANRTERSLYRAMLKEIEDSQYLIYIGKRPEGKPPIARSNCLWQRTSSSSQAWPEAA